jgi:hypothetical protein
VSTALWTPSGKKNGGKTVGKRRENGGEKCGKTWRENGVRKWDGKTATRKKEMKIRDDERWF